MDLKEKYERELYFFNEQKFFIPCQIVATLIFALIVWILGKGISGNNWFLDTILFVPILFLSLSTFGGTVLVAVDIYSLFKDKRRLNQMKKQLIKGSVYGEE